MRISGSADRKASHLLSNFVTPRYTDRLEDARANGKHIYHFRAVDQKHLESFEMWCWRRMEKISWTDHLRNEDVLFRVKEQRNILH